MGCCEGKLLVCFAFPLKQIFNEEDAIINVISRVPNADNELSGKQQVPTATPAITAVKCHPCILHRRLASK